MVAGFEVNAEIFGAFAIGFILGIGAAFLLVLIMDDGPKE